MCKFVVFIDDAMPRFAIDSVLSLFPLAELWDFFIVLPRVGVNFDQRLDGLVESHRDSEASLISVEARGEFVAGSHGITVPTPTNQPTNQPTNHTIKIHHSLLLFLAHISSPPSSSSIPMLLLPWHPPCFPPHPLIHPPLPNPCLPPSFPQPPQ